MSRKQFHQNVILLIALLLSILFIYTAVSKLMHLGVFRLRLERMPYISPYAPWLSWSVPFIELVIAGLLLIKKYRAIGIYISFVLLGLFTLYIMVVLQFSDHIPCSCGGVLSNLRWYNHILFNLVFMALGLTAILLNKRQTKNKLLDQNTT